MKNTQVSIGASSRILSTNFLVNFPKILEENVGNFCPSCGKTIFSNLLEIDGKVYIEKNCCTKELMHLENDVEFFQKHRECSYIRPFVSNPGSFQELISKSPDHPFMAISNLTTKCNMNCPICFLKHVKGFKRNAPDLPVEVIREMVKKYKSREVLLYTAEPTMREDLPEIIKIVKDSGNIPGIATNGLKLEDKNYVKELKRAGLKFVNFQFDGFNRKANIRLRGKDYLDIKLKALKNIEEIGGFRVGLAVVIKKELNENEIPKILQFALKNKFINKVTFISLLPPRGEDATTTYSDLAKAMEKYGYFDKEYFLEMVKMNRNIHEIARKIFEGTPFENWILSKLPDSINVGGIFKKGGDCPKLLFQKKEIQIINTALAEIIHKKNKTEAWLGLLKNSPKLINAPLLKMSAGRLSFLFNRANNTPKSLEVLLETPKDYTNRLLDGRRIEQWPSKIITSLSAFSIFAAGTLEDCPGFPAYPL